MNSIKIEIQGDSNYVSGVYFSGKKGKLFFSEIVWSYFKRIKTKGNEKLSLCRC